MNSHGDSAEIQINKPELEAKPINLQTQTKTQQQTRRQNQQTPLSLTRKLTP